MAVRLLFLFCRLVRMEVTESLPSIVSIKKLVDWDIFSYEQKWIIYSIVENKLTWRAIIAVWNATKHESLSFEAIVSCLLRSAMSRVWKKGENQGNVAYLCNQDIIILDNEIRERAVSHYSCASTFRCGTGSCTQKKVHKHFSIEFKRKKILYPGEQRSNYEESLIRSFRRSMGLNMYEVKLHERSNKHRLRTS